jgi:hypothetical protein
MKKNGILTLLLTTFIFLSCSEDLIVTDFDSYSQEELELKTSENSDAFNYELEDKGKQLKSSENQTEQASVLNTVSQKSNKFTAVNQINIYVDYSELADQYYNDSLSPDGVVYTLEDFINDYEAEMSNNFTIFQITPIDNVNYKWVVNESEYCNYLMSLGVFCTDPVHTGSNGVKMKKTPPNNDDDAF